MVLGLDAGGSCRGVGYRVGRSHWGQAVEYLRRREQVTMVYREVTTGFRADDGRNVVALTYAVDRRHPQYAGRLPVKRLAAIARHGQGKSGHCIDYIFNTLRHLGEIGIHDPELEAVAAQLAQTKDGSA